MQSRLTVRAFVVTTALLLIGEHGAWAQQGLGLGLNGTSLPTESEQQQRGAANGSSSVVVRDPGDPEVIRAERGIINPTAPQTTTLEQPVDPDLYICGRGDTFELNFWGQQNFKLRVVVDLEGRTFISKVGYVDIVGKTLSEARSIIKKAVARYYPGLNFDLSLAIPRSFLVHVIGFFSKPGLLTATPLDRVGTVLTHAGNITGSSRRIEVKRRSGEVLHADLAMYDLTGDSQFNPFVMDGDLISVPYPELSVNIHGPVKRPGRYELIASKDFTEALQLAEGYTHQLARQLPLRIVRRGSQQRDVEIAVPFSADGAEPKTPLKDGDQIYAPSTDELQQSILLVGPVEGASRADEATSTRRITFFEGATVRSVIERAGGLGPSADLQRAYVQHRDNSTTPVDLRALLILRDFSADRPLVVSDTIVVPQRRLGVLVEGAVSRPGVYPYNPLFSPLEYVGVAGGAKSNARSSSAYHVISEDGVIRPLTRNLRVQSGDTLVIPERTFSPAEITSLVISGVGLLLSGVSVTIIALRY